MQAIKELKTKTGAKRRMVIELDDNELITSIKSDQFYRLGEPMDDVMPGHVLANSVRVHWCPIEQRWV